MLFTENSYRSFLGTELVRRGKAKSPHFPRGVLRQLGVNPRGLSGVLPGKRPPSTKAAVRIAKVLGLNQAETKHLLYLVETERGGEIPLHVSETTALSVDLFAIVSDWYYFALLNLTECQDFRWSEKWIAKRLGIS